MKRDTTSDTTKVPFTEAELSIIQETEKRQAEELAANVRKREAFLLARDKTVSVSEAAGLAQMQPAAMERILKTIPPRLRENADHKEVTRFLNKTWGITDRRAYTTHEVRQALLELELGVDCRPPKATSSEIETKYGIPPRTQGKFTHQLRLEHGIDKKHPWTAEVLAAAVRQFDLSKSGPKPALAPAEAGLLLQSWSARAETGKGLSRTMQAKAAQTFCCDIATQLDKENVDPRVSAKLRFVLLSCIMCLSTCVQTYRISWVPLTSCRVLCAGLSSPIDRPSRWLRSRLP